MYMLDTNAFIILLYGEVAEGKLSEEAINILKTADKLYLSVVSLWEIAIKIKLGKLAIKNSITEIEKRCFDSGIEIIPIKATHMEKTVSMPLLTDHRDPFDRLILATAITEEMILLSTDEKIRRKEYGAQVIW